MKELSDTWREFYDYVDFCMHAAGFKKYNDEDEGFELEPEENVLAVYENPDNKVPSTIWVSNKALLVKTGSNEITRIPFEEIKNVRPAFDDILKAMEDSKLRVANINLKNNEIVSVPMYGVTNGDLDLLKLGFLVTNAKEAMGLVKPVNRDD